MNSFAILNIIGMCLALFIGDDDSQRFQIETVQTTTRP
jgi:hypothetical protein